MESLNAYSTDNFACMANYWPQVHIKNGLKDKSFQLFSVVDLSVHELNRKLKDKRLNPRT